MEGNTIASFYRTVRSNPPALDDFRSRLAHGLLARDADPETVRLEGGLSVYATPEQSERPARRFPLLGRCIAESGGTPPKSWRVYNRSWR